MILILMIMYVYAILLTSWCKGEDPHKSEEEFQLAFGNMLYSSFSLGQIIVYDDAFSLIRETFYRTPQMGFLLLSWLVLGGMTMLNMLIGVIVDIVHQTKSEEQEKMLVGRIQELFLEIDDDDSGLITDVEFRENVHMIKYYGLDETTCDL